MELLELDTLEELDELLDELLTLDELTILEDIDELIGGEFELPLLLPPPHAASINERTMGVIVCVWLTRVFSISINVIRLSLMM
jgi:hypothetical protein